MTLKELQDGANVLIAEDPKTGIYNVHEWKEGDSFPSTVPEDCRAEQVELQEMEPLGDFIQREVIAKSPFVAKVREMREAQRKYFQTRKRQELEASKALEAEVDRYLRILFGEEQTNMFHPQKNSNNA